MRLTDFGLNISASNVTLDLNKKKIVGDASDTVPGKIGVIIDARRHQRHDQRREYKWYQRHRVFRLVHQR